MSHTHDDRVAKRPTCDCAAYGCPMLGTMTDSTQGTGDWFCFLHFGKEAAQWQGITNELRRMEWLVEITRGVRRTYGKPEWVETWRAAVQAITVNGRGDLHKQQSESVKAWLQRLESVLSDECAGQVQAQMAEAA